MTILARPTTWRPDLTGSHHATVLPASRIADDMDSLGLAATRAGVDTTSPRARPRHVYVAFVDVCGSHRGRRINARIGVSPAELFEAIRRW